MVFNDRVAALLSSAVYINSGDASEWIPHGWKKFDESTNAETGFFCVLYTEGGQDSQGGSACFSFMGTCTSAGKELATGQMKSNAELRQDPDETMGIIEDAIKFVQDATGRLEREKGSSWKHYLTGHSLGGTVASCAAVACADSIQRCVTFESPGMIKHCREKAKQSHDEGFWKEKIVEYVSFPNPINTCLPHIGAVYRLHMVIHQKASPGHVIRCVVGSSLRFIVWVSLANAVAAASGHAQGFWAAKVGSVAVKMAKLLFACKFTPHRIKQAFQEGIKYDQASKDSRAAADSKEVNVDDPAAKPMLPILRLLPPNARPGFIVGFWAIVTAAASNTGYVSMRTLAQINDCMAEHNVEMMAKHFDEKTGEAECASQMQSWPYHAIMLSHDLPGEHFRRCILEGMTPFHPTAYGMHNLFKRQKLLLKRASTMPGFQEENNPCPEDQQASRDSNPQYRPS